MQSIDLDAKLVGREGEYAALCTKLEEAIAGKGSTVFISGESGVGKTRLARELISKNCARVNVLSGQCLHESLAPFLPFVAILRSAGLEHLILQERPPVIKGIYAIHKNGIMLGKAVRHGAGEIDDDIFSGMLTAVKNFIDDSLNRAKEVRSSTGEANVMRQGEMNIACLPGRQILIAAVFEGRESEHFLLDLAELAEMVESSYGNAISNWDGTFTGFVGLNEMLGAMLYSGKYDGIAYSGSAKDRQVDAFDNIFQGLARKSESRPLLVFIDDIQWADQGSLALLHFLARNIRSSKILILCTRREGESDDESSAETTRKMLDEGICSELVLERFGLRECKMLIESILGIEEDADEEAYEPEGERLSLDGFARMIYNETEGNALFVVELVKMMLCEEALEYSDGGWTFVTTKMKMPSRMHDTILQRIQKMDRQGTELLELASAIGDGFSDAQLSTISGIDIEQVRAALDVAENKHRLVRSVGEKRRFEHSKIKEVLYSRMNSELQCAYHEQIGKYLESAYLAGAKDVLPDIIHHYHIAGIDAKVMEHSIAALHYARALYANKLIVKLSNIALEALDRACDSPERFRMKLTILSELSDALENDGKFDEACKASEKRIAIARERDPIEVAKGYHALCIVYNNMSNYKNGEDAAEKGLAVLSGNTAREAMLTKGKLMLALGHVLIRLHDNARAFEMLTSAREIFMRENEVELTVRTLTSLGCLSVMKCEYLDAMRYLNESLEMAPKENAGLVSEVYSNIGFLHYSTGDYHAALDAAIKALEQDEKAHVISGICIECGNIGLAFCEFGEYELAMKYCKRALAISEKIGNVFIASNNYNNMGIIYHGLGKYDLALQSFEKSIETAKSIGNKFTIDINFLCIAEVHLDMHDFEGCERNALLGLELAKELSSKENEAWAMKLLGGASALKGDLSRALSYYWSSKELYDSMGKKDLAYYKMLFEYGKLVRDRDMLSSSRDFFSKLGNERLRAYASAELDKLE